MLRCSNIFLRLWLATGYVLVKRVHLRRTCRAGRYYLKSYWKRSPRYERKHGSDKCDVETYCFNGRHTLASCDYEVAHVKPRRAVALLWDGPSATPTSHATVPQLDHEGQRRGRRSSQAPQQTRQSRRRRYTLGAHTHNTITYTHEHTLKHVLVRFCLDETKN